jgi:hypothetical protein
LEEETGWEYALVGLAQDQLILAGQVDALHRIYAAPENVDEVAERMVRTWRRLPVTSTRSRSRRPGRGPRSTPSGSRPL